MGDFFRDWRRKTGVAALVMACMLMMVFVSEVTIEAPHRRRRDATWIEAGCFVYESWVTISVDSTDVINSGPNFGRTYHEPRDYQVVSENGRVIMYSKRMRRSSDDYKLVRMNMRTTPKLSFVTGS